MPTLFPKSKKSKNPRAAFYSKHEHGSWGIWNYYICLHSGSFPVQFYAFWTKNTPATFQKEFCRNWRAASALPHYFLQLLETTTWLMFKLRWTSSESLAKLWIWRRASCSGHLLNSWPMWYQQWEIQTPVRVVLEQAWSKRQTMAMRNSSFSNQCWDPSGKNSSATKLEW